MLHKLEQLCRQLDMPQEATAHMLDLAPQLNIAQLRPSMEGLLCPDRWDAALDELRSALDPDPLGMKMLTCMLLCALQTRSDYEKQGIPDSIFLATMDCFPRFVKEHMESYGCYGFDREFWVVRQLSCKIFRVGLLEFELRDQDVSLHIPSGTRLEPAAVAGSLETGRAFIGRYFPQWQDLPRTCHSWLLSPTLKLLLPETSNIIRFQQNFTIAPREEEDREFMIWVFKNRSLTLEQLPENTSLQRLLKAHLCAGGKFVDAKGILIT